jgi:hypothetical protein
MGEAQKDAVRRWVTIGLTAASIVWAVAVTVVANTRDGAQLAQRVSAHEERLKAVEQRAQADHDILIELRYGIRRIEEQLTQTTKGKE